MELKSYLSSGICMFLVTKTGFPITSSKKASPFGQVTIGQRGGRPPATPR